jgi:hypothetical protein
MGFNKFQELEFVYEYDFSVDGGGTGAKTLRCLNVNPMEAGLVLEDVQVYVETAFDDAGDTATVTLGITGTTSGFLADFMTLAETVNTPIRAGEVAGSLLWDDTNDHSISYRMANAAAATPIMTIGTEALTSGKASFVFKCRRYV